MDLDGADKYYPLYADLRGHLRQVHAARNVDLAERLQGVLCMFVHHMDPCRQMDHRIHACQRGMPIGVGFQIPDHDVHGAVREPIYCGRSHRCTHFELRQCLHMREQGTPYEAGGSCDQYFHGRTYSHSLNGYLDKILNQLVAIPLSRQARMTSRLSSTVLRQPRVLTPPVCICTNTSGICP